MEIKVRETEIQMVGTCSGITQTATSVGTCSGITQPYVGTCSGVTEPSRSEGLSEKAPLVGF